MMTRGKALREDLPPAFVEQCRHLEGFLTAINRELEDLSCRRQCRRRLRESRMVMARQYGILADALAQRRPVAPSRKAPSEIPHLRYAAAPRSQHTGLDALMPAAASRRARRAAWRISFFSNSSRLSLR